MADIRTLVLFIASVMAAMLFVVGADDKDVDAAPGSFDSSLSSSSLDDADVDKRIFRYGRARPTLRKRGGVMRWGKRAGNDDGDAYKTDSRMFRWGKRSDDVDEVYKRLFRWGKRATGSSDEPDDADVLKRAVFRFGRGGNDVSGQAETVAELTQNGLPGRFNVKQRTAQVPHVPFRFGEK